jgi:hypothetical protein
MSSASDEPEFAPHGRLGRVGLSLLLTLFCGFLVVWNLPRSEIRNEVRPVLRPVVEALAVDQDWGVFAPDPTKISIAVEADVELADGSVIRYRFPDGDPFVGAYREFRWRKWERLVRLDDSSRYWQPAAEWVAARFAERDPVRVTLVRRFADTPPPGSGQPKEWRSVEFYDYELDRDGGA